MKRKMVIKLSANCEKCRKKAMKVAATADGMISVALEGDDRDRLVVVGVGVDATGLTAALRKKACHANLEIVEVIIPPPPPAPVVIEDKENDNKDEKPGPNPSPPCHCPPPIYCQQPQFEVYKVIYDPYDPTPGCTIM